MAEEQQSTMLPAAISSTRLKLGEQVELWFWARSKGYKWHDLIVRVSGQYPFLRCHALRMGAEEGWSEVSPAVLPHITWGPEIPNPDYAGERGKKPDNGGADED